MLHTQMEKIKGTYRFGGQKIKCQGHTDIFCHALLSRNNSNSFKPTDLIRYTQMEDTERKRIMYRLRIDFEVKCQTHTDMFNLYSVLYVTQ